MYVKQDLKKRVMNVLINVTVKELMPSNEPAYTLMLILNNKFLIINSPFRFEDE